jgi:hypothetical protein
MASEEILLNVRTWAYYFYFGLVMREALTLLDLCSSQKTYSLDL